ncbi:MAG: bifunctional folylpolyglutamate synthase/dihydrofolate synthase, partial [Caulobacterales bacterium]|nr:bifunctional folylpolyglutamate synthase/dihydrofolate synthase [Caulobacterales bacterium]
AFAETPADLLLLEVGLGGVLDATNIIEAPAVSVIAPVDLDHREFLGDSLEAIAGEKAGILKRGAPAVVARQRPEAEAVIAARAAAVGAPLVAMGQDFDAWMERGRLVVSLGEAFGERLLDLPPPALLGEHQVANAGLAVAAAVRLGDARIEETAIAEGMVSATWPARFQRLTAGPLADKARAAGATLWLDGGHNPHAAAAVARTLEGIAGAKALVVGLLGNKDAAGVFQAFKELKPPVFAVGFEADAAAPPETIAEAARTAGLQAEACADVTEGLEKALQAAPGGHVLICGSLYLAGEVLAMSSETWPQ